MFSLIAMEVNFTLRSFIIFTFYCRYNFSFLLLTYLLMFNEQLLFYT